MNAQGGEGEPNVWGKRSEWVDYSGLLDGEKVGVVMMDHPGNPRHPTYWHSRGYGLHSINPFGVSDFLNDKTQNGSLTIEPGQHVRFRYRRDRPSRCVPGQARRAVQAVRANSEHHLESVGRLRNGAAKVVQIITRMGT